MPFGFSRIQRSASPESPRFRDLATIAQELRAQFVILGQTKADQASRLMLAHLIRMPDETHLEVGRLPLGKPESDAGEICKSFLLALSPQ